MKEIWKNKIIFGITIALLFGIIGTAVTFAVVTATTDTVVNHFDAGEVKTHIEEEFEGKIEKNSTVKKNPKIVNDGKSNAFIRARITVSPEDAPAELIGGAYDVSENSAGWYAAEDGWYYYSTPVKTGEATKTLFDKVKIGDTDSNFDITIYEESVYSEEYEAGKNVSLDTIQKMFLAVSQ